MSRESMKQEPMAWQCQCGRAYTVTCISSKPAKQWVGLTEKEWHEATGIPRNATLPMPMLKGIEKALKEKNHG